MGGGGEGEAARKRAMKTWAKRRASKAVAELKTDKEKAQPTLICGGRPKEGKDQHGEKGEKEGRPEKRGRSSPSFS